jgi:hypothetical protein
MYAEYAVGTGRGAMGVMACPTVGWTLMLAGYVVGTAALAWTAQGSPRATLCSRVAFAATGPREYPAHHYETPAENVSGINSTCTDCNNTVHGTAFTNACGLCVEGNTGLPWDEGKDACGVCSGDNSTCKDCAGVVNGTAVLDDCDECCAGTTGFVCDSSKDACGVCFGDNSTCADCDGVPFGSAFLNPCGECVEGTTGKNIFAGKDACGVCFGDNSTCLDCFGIINGTAKYDAVGVCNGTEIRVPCGEGCGIIATIFGWTIVCAGGCCMLMVCAFKGYNMTQGDRVMTAPQPQPRLYMHTSSAFGSMGNGTTMRDNNSHEMLPMTIHDGDVGSLYSKLM